MKVLLIFINNHLWWSVGRSFLIWFTTALLGSFILSGLKPYEDFVSLLPLGLVFTSPAIVIAIPVLYFLPNFQTVFTRAVFSASAILMVSMLIIAISSWVFYLPYSAVANVAYPFIPSAFICFFLITRKKLLSTKIFV